MRLPQESGTTCSQRGDQQPQGKRKGGTDQSNPRPKKRQVFWVEVPPMRRPKPPSTNRIIRVEAAVPVIRQESDQEMANALAAIRNVSLSTP